ncbi:MAG: ribonuclease domain-containing protein [Burkholderiales bacterium]|nr:ribonuclease domain-containing protein [Burkholderiales bacterium]
MRALAALAAALVVAAAALARPGLGEVRLAELPPEARDTVALIRQGGPFPYAKDGTVFGNREGLLPARPRGYYREYTVKTPGARDRGARRIVAGAGGELYYTDDHYRTFRRILE